MTIDLFLYIAAAVCFILAAIGVGPEKPSLVPLGLFFWVLTNLI